ncbi:hypothetical protein FisN_25Hu085 [Fistulifera solaris]|jgi:curved DNA-binding protein CbpA|uniref:J domain-containing protein n=1 Tax=Fistulifera solaris TaxID=1519565 RepID=A0A1Z5JVP9_FISSO|nr:hypothetical protein FisN_25Hu085 [Fistulifera solaris]|eukprot:GAX18107.1 hypothetical protein FisN_25Hu085 [Fistulifera solaris]
MKTHYESLGIEKTASVKEIKAAFRKLSLECHPDVSKSNDNGARFKEIANAASVLLNPKTRQQYDNRTKLQQPFEGFRRPYPHRPKAHSSYASSQSWFYRIHRPSNYILGPLVFFGTVAAIQYLVGTNKNTLTRSDTRVQAWKNPQTGQWEQPAPWDPLYRQLQPKLEYMPRRQVQARTR